MSWAGCCPTWPGAARRPRRCTVPGSRARQGRLFELLLGVVQRLAAPAPLLWVMEDLHWADRSTRDLVAYLAASLRSGRVLVVGTFRSDELDRRHPLRGLLGELARNRRVVRLELPRFTRAELAEQLAGLLGADPPARLVDDIYARSEGNPFFAEELLLAGDGGPGAAAQPAGGAADPGGAAGPPAPSSCCGWPPRPARAPPSRCWPRSPAWTTSSCWPGCGRRSTSSCCCPSPAATATCSATRWSPRRSTGELLPGERVRLHTALADALEAGLEAGDAPASRAARLAHHWSAAGDQPRALTASLAAAAVAEGVYAFAEAQLQLERVLALWDRVPDAEERAGMDRVGLLSRCAEAAYAAGDPPGPRSWSARPWRWSTRGAPAAAGRAAPRAAGPLPAHARRPCRAGRAAAGGAAGAARAVGGAGAGARLARAAAGAGGRFEEARGLAEEAVAIAGQVGARAEEANARTALGGALIHLGDADAGLAELAAAVRLATQAGDVILALRAILNHSDGLLAAGHLEEAATVALDGIQQARRLGLARSYGPILAGNATEALVALGRWDQAEQVSRQGLEAAPSDAASVPCCWLGPRWSWAAATSTPPRRGCRPSGGCSRADPEAQKAGPLFAGLAEVALWRGDLEQARQLVAEAVPLVAANPRYAAPVYALGLRVEADRAELARARHPGQPAPDDGTAAALLERLGQAAQGPAAAGLPELAAWHALGLAEQTRQHGPADPAAWAAAAAAWERLGQPYRAAYAGFRQAEALLAGHGDRDTAAAVLGRAAAITGRLGARLLDGEVGALARRARLDLAPPAAPRPRRPARRRPRSSWA